MKRHFVHLMDYPRKNGWSKSSEEISRSFKGCWILRRYKEVIVRTPEGFKAQEGQSHRSKSQGPSDLHEISCIEDSQVEAPGCCNENRDIAIHDILIRLGPSISGTHFRRFRGFGFRSIGVFKDKKLLQLGIAKRDILMGELCGPQQGLVEDRWHSIGDREKARPETLSIRNRDPANSEIPMR
jgi:hypothetical protein